MRFSPIFSCKKDFRLKIHFISIILLAISGLIVYSNTFYSPFHWDDYPNIVENRSLLDPLDFKSIAAHWPTRFFLFWTFSLNYALAGPGVFSFHLINILIHVTAASFLYLLIFQSLSYQKEKYQSHGKYFTAVSLLSALIFLLHPVATGAVTYIIQRGVSLASALGLLSLLLYVRARELFFKKGKGFFSYPHALYYGAALASLCLALLTKEAALVFPFLIAAWELVFGCRSGKKGLLPVYLLPFLLTLALLPVVALLSAKAGPQRDDFFYRVNIPWRPIPVIFRAAGDSAILNNCWEYFMTQIRSLAMYFRLTIFPLKQNFYYDLSARHSLFAGNGIFLLMCYLSLITVGIKLIVQKVSNKLSGWGILWFFFCLIPTSSVFILWPFLSEYHLYLSLAGFSFFLAGFIAALKRKNQLRFAFASSIFIIIFFGLLTWRRNSVYGSAVSLWEDTVRKSPYLAPVRFNLAAAYIGKGYYEKAVEESKMAIELNPDFDAYQNLWSAYRYLGKPALAEEAAREHIKNFPDAFHGYYELALIYRDKQEYEKAVRTLKKSLEMNPDFSSGYNELGVLYRKLDRPGPSRDSFITALKKDTRSVRAHYNLGVLYWKDYGNFQLARFHLRRAWKYSSDPALKNRIRLNLRELDREND